MIDEKKLVNDIENDYALKSVRYLSDDNIRGMASRQNEILSIIKSQPKIGEWVPCSDELPPQPKENPVFENKPLELYLVSVKGADYPFRAFWNGKFFTDGWVRCEAIAWKPLPEPYQPKGE